MVEDCQKQVHNIEYLDIESVEITEKERIRTTSGQDVEDLQDSINELGLFHPILVNKDNRLIAGYRRLKACKKLGWDIIPVFKKLDIDEADEIKIELQENITRKNLSPYEIDIGLAKLKKIYEKLHPETVHLAHNKMNTKTIRKNKNQSTVARNATYINECLDEEENERAKRFTQVVADYSNYSERTIRDRIQVGKAILGKKYDDNIVELYKKGGITHSEMLKRDRRRRRLERISVVKEKLIEVKKEIEEKEEPLKMEWCKDCIKAKISICPDCGKQIIICNKGYLITRSIDAISCEDYNPS